MSTAPSVATIIAALGASSCKDKRSLSSIRDPKGYLTSLESLEYHCHDIRFPVLKKTESSVEESATSRSSSLLQEARLRTYEPRGGARDSRAKADRAARFRELSLMSLPRPEQQFTEVAKTVSFALTYYESLVMKTSQGFGEMWSSFRRPGQCSTRARFRHPSETRTTLVVGISPSHQ